MGRLAGDHRDSLSYWCCHYVSAVGFKVTHYFPFLRYLFFHVTPDCSGAASYDCVSKNKVDKISPLFAAVNKTLSFSILLKQVVCRSCRVFLKGEERRWLQV